MDLLFVREAELPPCHCAPEECAERSALFAGRPYRLQKRAHILFLRIKRKPL